MLMRPDDPLAQKEVVHPEDLKDLPLILPRRQDVQNEITNWFGAYYQKLNIRFTCNMPTNGAKMVRKGLGYLITVQGVSEPVSYTHLDVYKRQMENSAIPMWFVMPIREKAASATPVICAQR